MKKININIAEGGCSPCGDAAPFPKEPTSHTNAHNGEEARMHRTTLAHLLSDVKVLLDLIQDGDDLPEWVQDKITTSEDRISSAFKYIDYNKIPELLKSYKIALMPYQSTIKARSNNLDISKYISPLKMFDYLASGKIIISSDIKVLRELSLPNPLTPENFQELAGKAKMEKLASATQLFKAGDVDRKTVYLLEGDVKLLDSTGSETMVKSGTENSRKPLANFQPRQHTAIAETECKVTRIDTDLLDILTTWDQVSGIEVSDIEDIAEDKEEDWMTLMLREKAFLNVQGCPQ